MLLYNNKILCTRKENTLNILNNTYKTNVHLILTVQKPFIMKISIFKLIQL